jgi:hypothetical protein
VLGRPNTKLGNDIWSWSIPPVKTCPGKTAICSALCYATKGRFSFNSVKERHRKNLTLAESPQFVSTMISLLREHDVKVMRIHVAGDFNTVEYVRKWQEIVRHCKSVTFYAYTRSWRVPRLQEELRKLAALPNMHLWLSCDKDTNAPIRMANTRRAYMSSGDNDFPGYRVDLVFRDRDANVIKWDPRGALVCPFENGVESKRGITCSRCKLCFRNEDVPRQPSERSYRVAEIPCRV